MKSVWAGSGAGGSGGCTVVIGTTCPRGAVVYHSILVAARVVRQPVIVDLVGHFSMWHCKALVSLDQTMVRQRLCS